jgi:ABC-type multidrug transport system fused ATPase/permease subunit
MALIGFQVDDDEPAQGQDPSAGRCREPLRAPKEGQMPLADSSYPLLNVFWSMFVFFLWIIWIWILITIFIDIFRSHDLSGVAKALWVLFVLFFPLIGVLVYLIARGGKMHEHAVRDARQQDQEFRQYVQQAAASSPASTADQLSKLAGLRDRGVISAEEFEREKAKVLAA